MHYTELTNMAAGHDRARADARHAARPTPAHGPRALTRLLGLRSRAPEPAAPSAATSDAPAAASPALRLLPGGASCEAPGA